jgi:FAD binding domain/Berberine and berberine like
MTGIYEGTSVSLVWPFRGTDATGWSAGAALRRAPGLSWVVVLIDRRRFLRLAGLGVAASAVASAAACTKGGPPTPSGSTTAPTTTPAPTTPAPTTTPRPTGPPDWAALRARLSGELLLPEDAGYDAARQPFNALYSDRRPAAIARCAGPPDVQACVEVARTSEIPIAARSGRHSYAAYSTPERGLVVDLGRMAGIEVRPDGTAVIGAGARLIDVYATLAAHGRAIPAGSCPSVGIAGLTLGGGQGVLGRLHGLTCDRLRAADVVLADATTTTATGTTGTAGELFWALRGGGGGNLGIVTTFTFDTVPARDVTTFSLRFGAGTAPAVLGAWQEWVGGAPDELWSNCIVSAGSPPTCRVGGCFVGAPATLNPMLDDLLRRAGATPTSRTVTARGHLDAMLYFAGCSTKPIDECRAAPPTTFVASSRVQREPMRDPAAVAAAVNGRRGIDLAFDSLGGAIRRIPADATAFPHRDALAIVQIYASGAARGPVAEVQQALAGLVGQGAYVNYIDPQQQDWAQAYYGANLPRLREAARRFDPDGVFRFPQGLVSA